MIIDLQIADTTCPRCAGRLVAALQAVPGVERAVVDWPTGRARVWCAPTVSPAVPVAAVAGAATGTRHRYRATVLVVRADGETVRGV